MYNREYKNGFEAIENGIEEFYKFINDELPKQFKSNCVDFRVDILEDEKAFVVEAELPGFEKDEIEIDIEDENLVIKAEHIEEVKSEEVIDDEYNKKYVHKERKDTKLERTLYFEGIDEDNISADLDNGVLTITLPKKEVKQNKKKIIIK